jgi:hypothetical protein
MTAVEYLTATPGHHTAQDIATATGLRRPDVLDELTAAMVRGKVGRIGSNRASDPWRWSRLEKP